jgi:queuine tRNA-ribosyltransferase
MLGAQLNTLHNLHYYQRLMADLRHVIEEGRLTDFVRTFAQEQSILEQEI